jgi:hypothetical protein
MFNGFFWFLLAEDVDSKPLFKPLIVCTVILHVKRFIESSRIHNIPVGSNQRLRSGQTKDSGRVKPDSGRVKPKTPVGSNQRLRSGQTKDSGGVKPKTPVGSNQRLENWYLLFLREARSANVWSKSNFTSWFGN